jgi:hypothetical protein
VDDFAGLRGEAPFRILDDVNPRNLPATRGMVGGRDLNLQSRGRGIMNRIFLPGNSTHGIGFLVGLLVVRVIDILRDAEVRRFL